VAATLGIVLGTVYELSGNIVVPSVIHGVYNAILFFGNWYIETQGIPREMVIFVPGLF
jgi:membrane protease YdiL (CAAX protease family)